MLQQTRAETVVPYFRAFVRQFPSFRALAGAPVGDVLKAWEGLGYYQRARRLHRLARQVVARYDGRLPRDPAALRALPGMGPYVSAAVASLAFGVPVPAVDGNVRRVVARLAAARNPSASDCRRWLTPLIPPGAPGRFNEAMMELGATVCRPIRPVCGRCPLWPWCRAFRSGDPAAFPERRPVRNRPHYAVGAAVTIDDRGRVLIARRRADAMLGGLWEFPGGKVEPGETVEACIRRELLEEVGLEVSVGPRLGTVRHEYSHFRITLQAHLCRPLEGRARPLRCSAVRWIRPAEADALAFSRADLKIWAALRAQGAPASPRRHHEGPREQHFPVAANRQSSTRPGAASGETAAATRSASAGSTSRPTVS